MTKPKISIVVAITSKNSAISKDGKLLHPISEDLKRFRTLTLGHPVIMGRKTYESIGRLLPGRLNIIVTRNPEFMVPDTSPDGKAKGQVCLSLEDALEEAAIVDQQEIFIIGGGELYAQALPVCDTLYLTIVESNAEGDVFFPSYKTLFPHVIFSETHTDPATGLTYTWENREKGLLK